MFYQRASIGFIYLRREKRREMRAREAMVKIKKASERQQERKSKR